MTKAPEWQLKLLATLPRPLVVLIVALYDTLVAMKYPISLLVEIVFSFSPMIIGTLLGAYLTSQNPYTRIGYIDPSGGAAIGCVVSGCIVIAGICIQEEITKRYANADKSLPKREKKSG